MSSPASFNSSTPMKVMGKFPVNCPGECQGAHCPKRVAQAACLRLCHLAPFRTLAVVPLRGIGFLR
jgi:hypothetical protein